jgi:hypothetical protein
VVRMLTSARNPFTPFRSVSGAHLVNSSNGPDPSTPPDLPAYCPANQKTHALALGLVMASSCRTSLATSLDVSALAGPPV